MQPTLCSKCKKNVAVVFISRMNEKGEPVNEGLCLKCAAQLGLPQVEDMMKRMGITPDDLENLNSEMMQAFGGAEELEDMPEDDGGDEDESGKTATFPFLNRLFGGSQTPAEKQSGDQSGQGRETKGGKTEKKRKFLDNYCINLSRRAREGKLDAVIIDSEPAKVFVEKNDTLKILDDPFVEEEYAIAYKKGNDELGQKLDDALTQLKEDGTLDEIVGHWIGDNADQVSYTPDDSVERNGKLVMATNAEFPPYESMDGDKVVGIDVDMMQAVCDVIGMELEVENMEFDSIIAAVQSGKADVGVAGMTVTPDREKNVSFTQGYATATQVIIVRKD